MHLQLLLLTFCIQQLSCILVNPTTIPVPRHIPNSPTFLPLNENEPQSLIPLWKHNIKMNLYLFIITDLQFSDYNVTPDWKIDVRNQYSQDKQIQLFIPRNVESTKQHYYAHIFLVKDSFPIDPANISFSMDSIVYVCHCKYRSSPFVLSTVKLIPLVLIALTKLYKSVPYWHQTITISLVYDAKDYISRNTLHPVTLKYFINSSKPISSSHRSISFYRPIIFPNDFWQTKKDVYPINDTTLSALPLTVRFESINVWKFNVYAVLANKNDQQTNSPQSGLDDSLSVLEQGYMFSITLLTCFMHGLFELLAFKNDIGFYRAKTNRIGISVYSLMIHIAIQAILLMYTMDFSNNAIRGCIQLTHLCVNVWKWNHVWLHEFEWVTEQGSNYGFAVRVERSATGGKHKLVEQGETKTQQLDTIAFKLLIVFAVPLFAIYNAYHYYYHYNMLIYHQLKNMCMEDWTRKVITNGIVNFLSIFGPIMAVWPQIYINCKMDMVNHISTHTMTYKIINIAVGK
ncbi:alcohol dehydrogenase [Mucor velutinosus]|uniref:Alcohol dehydrogenase n=1 Tax=Mucor velutinosus TaxID=708070 RepID=A0AAN7DK98_9FUNG|nr:alcohol dehydrogenase [Mucor velutinosus]